MVRRNSKGFLIGAPDDQKPDRRAPIGRTNKSAADPALIGRVEKNN